MTPIETTNANETSRLDLLCEAIEVIKALSDDEILYIMEVLS